MATVEEAKALICEICKNLYAQGAVSGTGGGMSIKLDDTIVMAPSGVQKERMEPADMFVLNAAGGVLEHPKPRPAPYKPPKLSECSPLFMAAYELRGAGAVLHSHSLNAVMATLLDEFAPEFSVTHLEMIKGIAGHGYFDNCVVPIIENTARECELTGRLREAIQRYPKANAVLVRRHGVYVWGRDWIHAKTQAECYDYLFEAAVRMAALGISPSHAPGPPLLADGHAGLANGTPAVKKARLEQAKGAATRPTAIVLDIEGTVAPISFVVETLFPYARARLASHLADTYSAPDTQAAIALFRQLAVEDAQAGREPAAPAVPPAEAGQEAVVAAVVASAYAQMDQDRKSTALKALQGQIWHAGFLAGELRAELFPDVPDALVRWRAAGHKTYIYSSGSRQAQADLFGNTTAGDLRPYLYGFFDTTSGLKVEAGSYREIGLALGADSPAHLLFATDVEAEAAAAASAGWQVALVVRPGNKPLAEGAWQIYRVIKSMEELV
ncbi:hypothetical protein WJX81_002858 [Elliptochloris bilobata]|uniref:Probable methylthioribulose-1-phosphate dehydratase n=1 Tax=Elliptochloris bilobata TaxID=381761 RepID=A0AAW1QW02_9CHLO